MHQMMLDDIRQYYGHSKSDLEHAVSKFAREAAKLIIVKDQINFQDDFDLSVRTNGDVHLMRLKDVKYQRDEQPLLLKGNKCKSIK